MKYVHDPEVYRRHFKGKALPAFQGQRMQHGNGFGFIRKIASPLIGAVAPHLAGAASKLARKAIKTAFPNSPMMQKVVGSVVKAGTQAAVRSVQKKPKQKKSRRIVRGTVRKRRNIFKEA